MSITIEAIYEAGILKPLAPLPDLPEHTKVRITVEAIAGPEQRGRVIDAHARTGSTSMLRWRATSAIVTSMTCLRAKPC